MATLEVTDLSMEVVDSPERFVDLLTLTADRTVGLGETAFELLTGGCITVGFGEVAFEILTDGRITLV